jgi:S1-C subfamily serine protease
VTAALAWPAASERPERPDRPAVRAEADVLRVSVAPSRGPARVATGFEVGGGRIVTVAHVLDAGGRVTVRGGDGRRRRATPVRIDRRTDLAVLAARLPRISPSRHIARAGPRLLVLRDGRSEGLPATVRRRIVARVGAQERPALELTANVTAGDSGAPLIGRGGVVQGVLFASSRTRIATAYAVDGEVLAGLITGSPG